MCHHELNLTQTYPNTPIRYIYSYSKGGINIKTSPQQYTFLYGAVAFTGSENIFIDLYSNSLIIFIRKKVYKVKLFYYFL